MDFFGSIKSGLKNHFDKRKEQQEYMERLQFEANIEKKRVFEEEFKKHATDIAIGKAKEDAARLSGMQKLRATNRLRNLSNADQNPGSFFEKLGEYTKKNMARREENLKRTEMMRQEAEKIKQGRVQPRMGHLNSAPRKAFGGSTWRM